MATSFEQNEGSPIVAVSAPTVSEVFEQGKQGRYYTSFSSFSPLTRSQDYGRSAVWPCSSQNPATLSACPRRHPVTFQCALTSPRTSSKFTISISLSFEQTKLCFRSHLDKKQLLELVARQPDHWPLKGRSKKLNTSTVTKTQLRLGLLDPQNKFSTSASLRSPSPLSPVVSSEAGPSRTAGTSVSTTVLRYPHYLSYMSQVMSFNIQQQQASVQTPHGVPQPSPNRTLRLYIEDHRPMDTPKKTVVSVLVPDAGSVSSNPQGAWKTPVKEMLLKLQESHGAIRDGGECLPRNSAYCTTDLSN